MKRQKRPSPAKLQKQCDDWNKANPIGTAVILKMDDGKEFPTKTRTEASVLSGHSPVVWLDGSAGCWHLDSVRPV